MTADKTVLAITGRLTYSQEISISQAAKILDYLNSEELEVVRTERGGASMLQPPMDRQGATAKKVSSPREALEVSAAQKNPEKIVALGAYVLQDGGETFKSEDVKTQFRRARETPPANFTRDLGLAISNGWVIEAGDGEYLLHNKFDAIFDEGFTFPKPTGAGRARVAKSNSSKSKATKPDSLEDVDAFHSTMPGYLPYAKMKTEKDRLLWVVTYMNEKHDRVGLTNKEIQYISDQMGIGVPNGHITGAFNTAKKAGYAFRNLGDKTVRVTDEGKSYLAALSSAPAA